jgi:hypothetical protein
MSLPLYIKITYLLGVYIDILVEIKISLIDINDNDFFCTKILLMLTTIIIYIDKHGSSLLLTYGRI